MSGRPVLALDVGGTKLAAALVHPDVRPLRALRRPTPRPGVGAEELFGAVTGLLDAVLAGAGLAGAGHAGAGHREIAGLGVGCGGPMTWPEASVSPLNIPAWAGFPLRERLQERYGGLPVRVHNDAVCVAVAEHWRGAGQGTAAMLGMVVSTGVGGGLVVGGRLVDGRSGNAGHVGHVVVDPEGPGCACGGRGCLEAVASGPRLAAWALQQGWVPGGAEADARQLAADARAGNALAARAFERAGHAVGVAVASATHLCDLEVVAVGGGLAQAGPLLFEPLQRAVRRHARMDFTRTLRVEPAHLGQEAGLLGAAALHLAGERYWSPAR
jgi:glucokinase